MVPHVVPLQPMEDPILEYVDMPYRKLQPTEGPYQNGLLVETAAHEEEPTKNQVF